MMDPIDGQRLLKTETGRLTYVGARKAGETHEWALRLAGATDERVLKQARDESTRALSQRPARRPALASTPVAMKSLATGTTLGAPGDAPAPSVHDEGTHMLSDRGLPQELVEWRSDLIQGGIDVALADKMARDAAARLSRQTSTRVLTSKRSPPPCLCYPTPHGKGLVGGATGRFHPCECKP